MQNLFRQFFAKSIAVVIVVCMTGTSFAQFAPTTVLTQGGTSGATTGATTGASANNAQAMQQSLQGAYVQTKPTKEMEAKPLDPTKLTDFEKFVLSVTGQNLPRFGSNIIRDGDQSFSPSSTAAVPNDYIVAAGDEVYVRVWGSVDGDLRLIVDRQGEISIPKVGAVKVAGVSYGSLNRVIENAISQTLTGANVSASIGKMGGVRVFVTGYAESPGAYTVNNLSSLVNVVMAAGGPSSGGSFRNIQLIRNGQVVSHFDLYDLLLKGNKLADRPVTAGDVINIGPAGGFVAVTGSVNQRAIYEIKKGEKVQEILGYAGGFAAGAFTNSVSYMGLATRREGFKEVFADRFALQVVKDGDIFYAASEVQRVQPTTDQKRMVMVDGEVNNPGLYLMGPSQTLQDAIMAAGGFTSSAYLFGTRVERISVKQEQTKAINRFKSEARKLVANDSLRKQTTGEDAQLAAAYRDRITSVLAALEEIKPEGRLALGIGFNAKELPPALLETGDVITVPPVHNNVTLVGSIPSGQITLAYRPNHNLGDYINLSGGYNKGADSSQSYVMRASGQFTSATASWFASANSLPIYPGDIVFVPEEMQKTTWMKELKDWATIFYQLGLGVAAIKILRQ